MPKRKPAHHLYEDLLEEVYVRAAPRLPHARRVRMGRLHERDDWDTFARELILNCIEYDLFEDEEAEDLLEWNDNTPIIPSERAFFAEMLSDFCFGD